MCNCDADWRQTTRQSPCDNEVAMCSLPEWITDSGTSVVTECLFGGECVLDFDLVTYEEFWRNSTTDPDYPANAPEGWYQPDNTTIGNISCSCPETRLGAQCEICEYRKLQKAFSELPISAAPARRSSSLIRAVRLSLHILIHVLTVVHLGHKYAL